MLQDYIADVPADSGQLMFRQALDEERAMLNREKLTLAAEVVRREPPPVPPPASVEAEAVDAAWDSFEFVEEEEPRSPRAVLWFVLVLAALAAAAAAAWFIAGPDALTAMMHRIGVIR
jgi:hypothetical protein